MDIMRLSKEQADAYVLGVLKENIDCSDHLEIITAFEKGKVHYQLEDEILYHDKYFKRITPLGFLEYIMLLKKALAKRGYQEVFIKPVIRGEVLKYEVSFRLLDKVVRRSRRK